MSNRHPVGALQRRAAIVDELNHWGFVSTPELALLFSVSSMTIRRDIQQLQFLESVRAVRGGVALPDVGVRDAEFAGRVREDAGAKEQIALACQQLIGANSSIIVDAGTTSFEVARRLPSSFRGTLITHSAPVIQHALRLRSARTICLGGELLADSQAFGGAMTITAVENLHAKIAFIGVSAMDARGLYIDRDLELLTKRAIIGAADQVIVVAVHKKMGHPGPVHLMGFDGIDTVVTDQRPPNDLFRVLDAAGVAIIVADNATTSAQTSTTADQK